MSTISKINIGGGILYEIADDFARNEIEKKADKTALESIASGSPAGVYNSLSDLQSADVIDKTRIYVTKDDGNWNYWNGSTWVSGGVYQSSIIPQNIISPEKTTFLEPIGNLYISDYDTDGYRISPTNGEIEKNDSWFISDFIRIQSEIEYKIYSQTYAFYDSDKTLLSYGRAQSFPIISSPEEAIYVRISSLKTDKQNVYIVDKNSKYTKDIAYRVSDVIELGITKNKIPKNSISPEKTTFLEPIGNLHILDYDTDNFKIDPSNGVYTPDDNWFVSDFMNVESGVEYKIYAQSYAFYDSDKSLLSYGSATTFPIVTAPETAMYARISSLKSDKEYVYIADNDSIYVGEHKYKHTDDIDIKASILNFYNKRIYLIGDSITYGDKANGKPYHVHLKDLCGLKVTADGRNGTCISPSTGKGQDFISRLNLIPQTADIIGIFGGTNDWGFGTPLGNMEDESTNTNTFYGALKYIAEYLIKNYTDKTFFFITPIQRNNSNSNENGNSLKEFAEAVKNVASYYSIPYINVYDNFLCPSIEEVRNIYMEDGLHPNENGHVILARKIANFINYVL